MNQQIFSNSLLWILNNIEITVKHMTSVAQIPTAIANWFSSAEESEDTLSLCTLVARFCCRYGD